jgi:dihydrofolate synthase/folylpolyglutamate synthase
MNFDESLAYLHSLGHETLAINFDLNHTLRLLEALGQPQQNFLKVQIAGTNGKGSTANMLDAITRASGIKTALYTSPHLVNITERMHFNGPEISRENFALMTNRVRETAARLIETGTLSKLPTIFEHLTVMFLAACADERVELAILETGLGGRLDATTAARAEVAAITPVALDHQEYLGHTLALIAAEKAAIIHSKATVILAPQPREAMEVMLNECAKFSITPRMANCETEILGADERGRLRLTFRTCQNVYEAVRLGLPGRHQLVNASVAIAISEALNDERGLSISREAIIAGLESAAHPGRLEWQDGEPSFLFDGAHNAAGARALREYLDEFVSAPVTLIFGAMRDKDLALMAAQLFAAAERLILTEMDNARSATRDTLAQLASQQTADLKITLAKDVCTAIEEAMKQTPPEGIICVTGSLNLIGEVKAALQRAPDEIYAN